MKAFSLSYLSKSAHNAACQEVARALVCKKYGLKEISRREALRAGFHTGGDLNEEVQRVAKLPEAAPTFEQFAVRFADLCDRHGVVFEGGLAEFLGGVLQLRKTLGLDNPFRQN